MSLYDYIYVDLNKVISLYSQMTGGLVEVIERTTESTRTADNKRNYDFKIFSHDAGGTDVARSNSKETVKPHHALLKELEGDLLRSGYLADLTDGPISLKDADFRAKLRNTFCVKVRGRAIIEDYERIKGIAAAFPQVMEVINKSTESSLRSSHAYLDLKGKLDSAEAKLKRITDRNERAVEARHVREMHQSLSILISSASKVEMVDQWILDGMKTWIDSFLPCITNLRIYPNPDRPDEHVFGHLKKSCFEDVDVSSFHFTYGSFPTEDLTMIGVVTSVPEDVGEQFKPLSEFNKTSLRDEESVEKGFRGVFRGFDGIEQMIRTCRYPRILVLPLTVYRSVAPNLSFVRDSQ